ncbi:MAG: helix-turn-helix transcriptional regulator [Myxococcota bacterium]
MTRLQRHLSRALKRLRRSQDLSQAALAEQAGVSTELVSRIERAKCFPSVPTLVAFAKALRTTPNELLGFGDPDLSEHAQAVVQSMQSLPSRRQEEVRRVAEALAVYKPVPE